MKYGWVNMHHPEARQGEVLLTNADSYTYKNHIGRKTKRKGVVAYDMYNRPLRDSDFFPVFVQRSDLEADGIDPDSLWNDKEEVELQVDRNYIIFKIAIVILLILFVIFVPK